jgi:hypothetical protein
MRIKVFTLPFSSGINGFDDKPAREFLSDKKIVFVREHFFTENNRTYLALVVCYQATIIENQQDKQKKNRNDWKAFIKEENVPLFNSLREWRRERAKSENFYSGCFSIRKNFQNVFGSQSVREWITWHWMF